MQSAIFGLVGVALGGLITWGTEFFFTNRREAGERKARDAAVLVERRLVARLIDFELQKAEAAIAFCRQEKKWWPTTTKLSRAAWDEGKSILAQHYGDDEWQNVMLAMIAVEMLGGTYTQHIEAGKKDAPLDEEFIQEMNVWADTIRDARAALASDARAV